MAAGAQGQLVAVDDTYSVPYGESLLAEAPGVLSNDTFDGDPAEDAGAEAVLVDYASYGVLGCESDPGLDICPDGSFTYTPDLFFPGSDSFTYEAVVGSETQQATVTLSACGGGPPVYTCWAEAPYLAKLGELGYGSFQEGFEDDGVWGSVREPTTALSVVSQGIAWQSNHPDPPAENGITTGTGPARTGLFGVYDPDHGYATGTPEQCNVDTPPAHCLYHDGFTGTRESGESTLYGVGGHLTGSLDPNLVMILDGGAPIGLGLVSVGDPQFFGVIDTTGFTSFRVQETDGKVGQIRLVFGDDFIFGTTPADTTPPQVAQVGSVADTGDGVLGEGEVTAVSITQLLVSYSELVDELGGEVAPGSVTNPANYLLFSDGGDGFDTVDCATGVDAGDTAVPVDWVSYVSGSELLATLDINGGAALPSASYRLLVCGTPSIQDWAGNALDGDGNGTGGDDFQRGFSITPCTLDADCDDSLFCNGAETCNAGSCQAGAGPCAAGSFCNELADLCEPVAHPGPDRTIDVLASVALGGTPSGSGGAPPYSYSWTLDPVVGATLTSASDPNPILTGDQVGIYAVTLVVTDSLLVASQPAMATITVLCPPTLDLFDRIISGTEAFVASDTIWLGDEFAALSILSGADASFRAGANVILRSGVTIESGATVALINDPTIDPMTCE